MTTPSIPLPQLQQTLPGTGRTGGMLLLYGVQSMNSNSTVFACGGRQHSNDFVGSVEIYERKTKDAPWIVSPQAPLVGSDYNGTNIYFGTAVSLSDSGFLVVGGYGDNDAIGALWVFANDGKTWTQSGPKLVGTGLVGSSQLGQSVVVSNDGFAFAGGPYDNNGFGCVIAFAFDTDSKTWSQFGPKIVPDEASGSFLKFGWSVSVSSSSSILAVGSPYYFAERGACYIFQREANGYTQQTRLIATGYRLDQGYSVSLSESTLLVGSSSNNVWFFQYSNSSRSWSQLGGSLTGSGGSTTSGSEGQGYSVSLSKDGLFGAVGGLWDAQMVGATWLFRWNGTGYSQWGEKIATQCNGPCYQGTSVSLNFDGSCLLVYGYGANNYNGSSWSYEITTTSTTMKPNSMPSSPPSSTSPAGNKRVSLTIIVVATVVVFVVVVGGVLAAMYFRWMSTNKSELHYSLLKQNTVA